MSSISTAIPETMQAVTFDTYGAPMSVLKLSTNPVPTLAAHEVLIRVYAAAMNGIDYKIVKGDLQLIFRRTLPARPGLDVSGVVAAVGADCTRIKVGDDVFAFTFTNFGGFAEFAAVEESTVSLKPPNLSFVEAAAIPCAGLTAYKALARPKLSRGQKLLILGGSGGVGSFAIQLAKRSFGASQVAVTCSERNTDYVRALGADIVIDYNKQSYRQALVGQNFDVILDTVGGYNAYYDASAVLKSAGVFITIVGDQQSGQVTILRAISTISTIAIRTLYALVGTAPTYISFIGSATAEDLDKMTVMINNNEVQMNGIIQKIYAFNQDSVRAMFAENEAGHVRGKLVLQITSAATQKH